MITQILWTQSWHTSTHLHQLQQTNFLLVDIFYLAPVWKLTQRRLAYSELSKFLQEMMMHWCWFIWRKKSTKKIWQTSVYHEHTVIEITQDALVPLIVPTQMFSDVNLTLINWNLVVVNLDNDFFFCLFLFYRGTCTNIRYDQGISWVAIKRNGTSRHEWVASKGASNKPEK